MSDIMNPVTKHGYRRCVICKVEQKPGSGVFLARFPLDTYYCRLWVKAVGEEDFLHIPPAVLHKKKYVCGKHFEDKCFGGKKKRLKHNAVPTRLLRTLLNDELLENFPPKIEVCHTHRFIAPNEKQKKTPCSANGDKARDNNNGPEPEKAKEDINKIMPNTGQSTGPDLSTAKLKSSDDTNVNDSNITLSDQINESSHCEDDGINEDDNTIDISAEENFANDDVQFVAETQVDQEQQTYRHSDFRCNVCRGDIIGFRYTCVQCVDWDMCASCEARGEHPEHYVLRLPAPKPYRDHAPVLAAIRDHIQELLNDQIHEVYFKEEAIDEEIVPGDLETQAQDPISIINDRSVPEIILHQETETEETQNICKKLSTPEYVLKTNLTIPDIDENLTKNNKSKHSYLTYHESEVKSETTKVHKPNSESSIVTNSELINKVQPKMSTVRKVVKILPLSALNSVCRVKIIDKLPNRKNIIVRKSDILKQIGLLDTHE